MKTAVIISNLGTPESYEVKDVKTYLDEFLMDPYVIDMPYIFRALFVKGFILQTRPKKSAAVYKSIWTKEGSPLLVITQKLINKVKALLPTENYDVYLAMRYGEPSFQKALNEIKEKDYQKVLVLPLYPQYAYASVESTRAYFKKITKEIKLPPTYFLDAFYDDEDFADCIVAQNNKPSLSDFKDQFDHFLFSYHGVPEKQIRRTDPSKKYCLKSNDCCKTICEANKNCYKMQCIHNAQLLARKMNLNESEYSYSFQSRLGPIEWIKPYTDKTLEALAKKGIKRLAVYCPAFSADCLETLEEIAIEGAHEFKSFGGESLTMIPAVNDSDPWAKLLARWISNEEKMLPLEMI